MQSISVHTANAQNFVHGSWSFARGIYRSIAATARSLPPLLRHLRHGSAGGPSHRGMVLGLGLRVVAAQTVQGAGHQVQWEVKSVVSVVIVMYQ